MLDLKNMDFLKIKQKKIFVVGGSGLLGSEICNLLSGYQSHVYNLDIKTNKILDKKIKYLKFDVSKKNRIEKKLKYFFKKFGSPDCLINCSYPTSKSWSSSSFQKVTQRNINDNLSLHLNSYIWIARICAEEMKNKKIKGSIIQFGSHYGVIGQSTNIYNGTKMNENMIYSAIKGGIINNVRQMSSHYGRYGIRVNSICPAGIEGHVKGKKNKQPKKFISNYIRRTPLGRLAKSNEISPAVAFLVSDASSYITGITLMVDGGWTAT